MFEFIKEYINEIGQQHILIMSSTKKDTTDKMESLDWMVRNMEFISPVIYNEFVKTCRDLYNMDNSEKITYFFSGHISDVLLNMRRLIIESSNDTAKPALKRLLPSYLEALEIAFLNEFNQERSIEIGIHDVLIKIITQESKEEKVSVLAEKCMAILMKKDDLIKKCAIKTEFIIWLSNTLNKRHKDIVSYISSFKLLSLTFKSIPVTEMVLKHNSNLPIDIIRFLRISKNSNLVMDANADALLSFSYCLSLLDHVKPADQIEIVIEVANEMPIMKIKKILYKALRNFGKKTNFLEVLHRNGMLDVINNSAV